MADKRRNATSAFCLQVFSSVLQILMHRFWIFILFSYFSSGGKKKALSLKCLFLELDINLLTPTVSSHFFPFLCVLPGSSTGNLNWCHLPLTDVYTNLNERFIFHKCERRSHLESCSGSFGCFAFWHWKEQLCSPWGVYSFTTPSHEYHMHVWPTRTNFFYIFIYSCRLETRHSACNLIQNHIRPDHRVGKKKASKNKIAILDRLQA